MPVAVSDVVVCVTSSISPLIFKVIFFLFLFVACMCLHMDIIMPVLSCSWWSYSRGLCMLLFLFVCLFVLLSNVQINNRDSTKCVLAGGSRSGFIRRHAAALLPAMLTLLTECLHTVVCVSEEGK